MMKKLLSYLLIALPALLMQSCLHDQEDMFDEPSALRLQKAVAAAHDALVNNQEMWVLDYYPEGSQSLGGYSMILKFEEEQVTVWRLKETEERVSMGLDPLYISDTSDYQIKAGSGPVLTFDTYNDAMHYFSTPRNSSDWYQALWGDFEFTVDSISTDKIKLRGKRTENVMYLRAFQGDPVEYLTKADDMVGEFIYPTASFTHEGIETPIKFDLDNRQVVVNPTNYDKREYIAFCFIPNGLRLYRPLEVNGTDVMEFSYNGTNQTLVSTESPNSVIKLEFAVGYKMYDEWPGDYDFVYTDYDDGKTPVKLPVTIAPSGDGMTLLMKGLNENYDVVLNYSRSTGQIELCGQQVGEKLENGHFIQLTAWDSKNGYVNYAMTYGMRTKWDEGKNTYVWEDNEKWSGRAVISFILYDMSAVSTRFGQNTEESYKINGSNYLYKLISLDKK